MQSEQPVVGNQPVTQPAEADAEPRIDGERQRSGQAGDLEQAVALAPVDRIEIHRHAALKGRALLLDQSLKAVERSRDRR